jgi:hypothetical protein
MIDDCRLSIEKTGKGAQYSIEEAIVMKSIFLIHQYVCNVQFEGPGNVEGFGD